MLATLRRLLGIPTLRSEDEDRRAGMLTVMTVAIVLAAGAALGILLLAPGGATPFSPQIVGLVAVAGTVSLLLLRSGRLAATAIVTFGAILGSATALLVTGDGIHDIAILLFPVVLLYGGLFFPLRRFVALTVATIVILGLVAVAEVVGKVRSLAGPTTAVLDFALASVVLSVSAVGVALLARNLLASLALAASREEALREANTALAERDRDRDSLIRELEGRNEELERFTYTVSHDLKSPVVTIRGFLGYIRSDARAGRIDRMDRDLERIGEATSKMQALLDDLLELSRIGRLMNPPEDAPFGEIVSEAVRLVHGRLSDRGVTVSVAQSLPVVHGDRARLVEVVQNLVDNAAKFMGAQAKPRIEIGCRPGEGGELVFCVSDNGKGIDPRFHARIFGLFEKLDSQMEGTGIGLALVKRIVEVHGGRIWVESQGDNAGSTFVFTLPPPPLTPSTVATTSVAPRGHHQRVTAASPTG